MVFACVKLFLPMLTAAVLAATDGAKNVTVMVFGDSYGDTGPTYHQVQDMFDTRGVPANVQNAAIGGTAACHWAAQDDGKAMVTNAQKLFPNLPDGPDFVWYTLGGNDIWQDDTLQACQKNAKTWDALMTCINSFLSRVEACTQTNLDNYFKAFPKSKVLQSGYEVPCANELCKLSFDKAFNMNFCGQNTTCSNDVQLTMISKYIGDIGKKYSSAQYTALLMMGAAQKAAGIVGADVGKPVLDQGSKCDWMTMCVHPTYNTPAGKAWGDAFWDLYFSQHVNAITNGVLV